MVKRITLFISLVRQRFLRKTTMTYAWLVVSL